MNFRQTVKLSHFEGGLYALMVASTESFLFYWAVKQNVSPFQLAILSSLPLLIGSIAQMIVPKMVKEKHLGVSVVYVVLVQIIGVLGILYNVAVHYSYLFLLISTCIYFVGGLTSNPLWIDWASRIIPRRNFRKYMAGRSSYTWYLILFFYMTMAFLGQYSSWFKLIYIFIIGAVARILSCSMQTLIITGEFAKKMKAHAIHKENLHTEKAKDKAEPKHVEHLHNPKHELSPETKNTIWTFITWTSLFRFGAYVSAPFFVPYMLNDLKLPMAQYVILTSIPYFGRALFFNRWGRAAKGHAAFFGVQLTMLYISFTPVVWLLTKSFNVLIFTEVLTGIAWGGFELNQVLMIQNFTHADMKEGSRVLLGLHMALTNFFGVLGAIMGSVFLDANLGFLQVFLISAMLRFAFSFILIHKAKALRRSDFTVKHFKSYVRHLLPSYRPRRESHYT